MNTFHEKPCFACVLDHKPGFLLGGILYRIFKRFHFDESIVEELKRLRRQGTIVYAMKYPGRLDYLLYHYRYRTSRLPYPKIAFGLNMLWVLPLKQILRVLTFHIKYLFKKKKLPSPYKTGFFKEAVMNGTTCLLPLIDPKGFARRFIYLEKDALQFLLETQKELERPIYIVPQLVLYKKTPEKEQPTLMDIFFGYQDNPGVFRKIGMFLRHHRHAFIDFGKPLDLKAYLEGEVDGRPLEEMTREVRQVLIDRIDVQKRVILGPVMKTREQLKERVLDDPGVIRTIESMAEDNPRRIQQLRKKAGAYFDEIAADYNIAYIQFFQIALTWLWNKLFQGIDVLPSEIAMVREWVRKGPTIYVPSHKSHIDYLVLNYVLYLNHMHVPRIAAGKNLSFWPMGHIFRKSGAFFIRRSFRGAKLYTAVFERYIKALLEEGHPLEFFIEGGRSRSGKLILPKLGFLSILLQAQKEGFSEDLIFVPASITYDRILEEKAYLKELSGGKKEKESFRQFMKARHFLSRKYGRIYIRFGQPLSLNEYLARHEVPRDEAAQELAFHLIKSINKATLVTPLALIATAVLTKHRRGFYEKELMGTAEILLRFLKNHGIPMSAALEPLDKAVGETISYLIKNRVMNILEDIGGEEIFYYVEEEKKPELEYYKNSIIHCFIPHAFVALSLLRGKEEVVPEQQILSDYAFMKNLFKNEFIFEEMPDIQEEVSKLTRFFQDADYIERDTANGGYRVTRIGFEELPIWAALPKTFIESYWIAAQAFIRKGDKSLKQEDLLKNMNYLGLRYHKLGLIEHRESINQLSFKNALRYIQKEVTEVREISPDSSREKLSRLGERLYELSHYRF